MEVFKLFELNKTRESNIKEMDKFGRDGFRGKRDVSSGIAGLFGHLERAC